MRVLEIVIRDAEAVLPTGVARADIGIREGKIAAIAEPGTLEADRVVNAAGLVLLPGGIDPHVHVKTRFGNWETRDDFFSATVAAAFGGTTTFVEFAIPSGDESAAEAVSRRREEAANAIVDYSFHACVTPARFGRSLAELEELRAGGIGSVKVFSTYRDTVGLDLGQIHQVLRECARTRQLVLVHAETDSLIQEAIELTVATATLGPRGHLESRPAIAEADAIQSIAALAADVGAHVYFVHVSSRQGMEAVAEARRRGNLVNAETCTPYLFLDSSVYDRADGELWICSPPIRSREHQSALWRGVETGVFDVVSTDHNCFDRAQKGERRADFREVPNGLPGVEVRMPLLLGSALAGRLGWERLVRVTAENPARIFGLWPGKGAIAPGFDADLLLLDPAGHTDLSETHMATDYSPFMGMNVAGRIAQTWIRGVCVVKDGAVQVEAGYGRWQRTAPGRPVPAGHA